MRYVGAILLHSSVFSRDQYMTYNLYLLSTLIQKVPQRKKRRNLIYLQKISLHWLESEETEVNSHLFSLSFTNQVLYSNA